MVAEVTPDAVSALMRNPGIDEDCEYVVQVLEIKPIGTGGTKFTCSLNDGNKRVKGMLPSDMAKQVQLGTLRELGLLKVQDYTCNELNNQKVVIVTKGEITGVTLDYIVGQGQPKKSQEKEQEQEQQEQHPAEPESEFEPEGTPRGVKREPQEGEEEVKGGGYQGGEGIRGKQGRPGGGKGARANAHAGEEEEEGSGVSPMKAAKLEFATPVKEEPTNSPPSLSRETYGSPPPPPPASVGTESPASKKAKLAHAPAPAPAPATANIGDSKAEREVPEGKVAGGLSARPTPMDATPASKAPAQRAALMSASQIVKEQQSKAVTATRTSTTRRVFPIVALNPYQGSWTIKVQVTYKGPMRTYKSQRGEGSVFKVEFTDDEGTQIEATAWKEAADKYYPLFEVGKTFYVSKGSLKMANKKYSNVKNDYEMHLDAQTQVEEVAGGGAGGVREKYDFVRINEMGPHVGGKGLVDLIGIVKEVGSVSSVRRKSTGEEIFKRELTLADQSQKTVVVTLWGQLSDAEGAKLVDVAHLAPVVAIKSLKVGDYQGVSLSTTLRSTVAINPEDVPEAEALRSWYDSDGKSASMAAVGLSMPGGGVKSSKSVYNDRSTLAALVEPGVGAEKTEYFNVRLCVTYIKPEQTLYYAACTSDKCNKKVTATGTGGYWCEACQKESDSFKRRYIMMVKASDATGEAWVSTFNEQAEQILGISADELAEYKEQGVDNSTYLGYLSGAMWRPLVFRVSVAQQEYMNEKRQRITLQRVHAVDWAGESALLLREIDNLKQAFRSTI